MKKILLLTLFILSAQMSYEQANCVGAVTLTPGVQQCGDSAGQPGDFPADDSAPVNPCDVDYNDDEYWFEYTAVAEGESLDLTVSSISETWAGVFVIDDCPSGTPSCVSSDANGGSTADLSLNTGPLTSGTSYKIVISNYGTPDNTTFCLDATVLPPLMAPVNDDCGGALNVMVNSDLNCTSTTSGTLVGATASPEDDVVCGGTENDDVWFRFVATATEHSIGLINIANGTTDLYHSLWEGTCGSLTLVPGTCSDPESSTPTGLTIGNTYYIRVYSWTANPGQTSTFDICIGTNPPPPPHDACTGAITIPVSVDMCTGITTGNNTGATDSNNDVPAPPAATCDAYGGGDIWFSLTIPASGNVIISGANSDGCCSYLWYEMYTGSDCSTLTSIGCSDTNSGTDNNDPSTYETSLTGQTPGSTIWIRAWDSSNDNGPGDFNFCAYELSCTAPIVSIPADPIDNTNCPTTVDVSISIDDLGDSGTLTISAIDDMGNPAGIGGTVTATGVFIVTNIPVPQTSWTITIAHETNPTCNVVLGPFLLNCPPVNDNICNAETITVDAAPLVGNNAYSTFETDETAGTCWVSTTENNSVWYSFVSPGSGSVEITTDFPTSLTDSQISLYEVGNCANLTTANEIGCDEDGGTTGNGWMSIIETSGAPLTGGSTYYVQVDGYGASIGEFQIQINELAPDNDECVDADVLAMNTTGSLINQYFGGATASGMGAEICDVMNVPTPADVWYSVNTDADGGNLIIVVEPGSNSDVVVAIYDACGSTVPEQCVDLGGNGGIETINFNANVQNDKGGSSTRDADYFIRIYEKIPSGQPFEIGAQGAALPIELSSFEAKAERRGNMVLWSTLSERNSDYVEVYSSPNGSTNWDVLGRVETKGESTTKQDYEFLDMNPSEVTYYRLNAVDNDGKSEMSGVVNVRRELQSKKMVLSPNPTKSQLTMQIENSIDEAANVTIVDLTGKLVLDQEVQLQDGLNTLDFDLLVLNAGVYIFSIETANGVEMQKIVKQ